MNSGTLIASLIFAGMLVVLIGFLIQLMVRGWRRRAQRQAAVIGTLPPVPDTVGPPTVAATRGLYVGCTLVPSWNDLVAVGDLGYRTKAVLTRYPEGIMVQRSAGRPIWIPQDAIIAVRTERGIVGKALTHEGILVIRWRLPSGSEIDTGFRADNRNDYDRWLQGEQ
ncbi:transporter [Mycobacterium sp. pUA109]|uniref:PH-like domain-containing protein n=1 Tax=Mycobacterium sp. pUA109 TaxID=3238982 RepID=UPI00351BB544